MLRRAVTSLWTSAALSAIAVAVHLLWILRTKHAGEVLSGLGSVMVVIGLLVAAKPFIRSGVTAMAERQPQLPNFMGYDGSDGVMIKEIANAFEARVHAAVPDVWAERVVAVVVVVLGTLLNGYGTHIARVLGLRI